MPWEQPGITELIETLWNVNLSASSIFLRSK